MNSEADKKKNIVHNTKKKSIAISNLSHSDRKKLGF